MYSTLIVPLLVSIITTTDFAKSITTKTSNETEMFFYEIRPEFFNWTNGIMMIKVMYLYYDSAILSLIFQSRN